VYKRLESTLVASIASATWILSAFIFVIFGFIVPNPIVDIFDYDTLTYIFQIIGYVFFTIIIFGIYKPDIKFEFPKIRNIFYIISPSIIAFFNLLFILLSESNFNFFEIDKSFLLFIMVAPVFEELFFRGFVQSYLSDFNGTYFSIFFSSFLFSIVHIFTYISSPSTFYNLLMIFVVSILFGIAHDVSGNNIISSILSHISYNMIIAVSLLFT
jgi:membrane protease YdiL (CAAX protease family)